MQNRVEICEWITDMNEDVLGFLTDIWFSDEAHVRPLWACQLDEEQCLLEQPASRHGPATASPLGEHAWHHRTFLV